MMFAAGLRPHVVNAKERLAEGRAKLEQRHRKGSPGVQVCCALAELFDQLVLDLFQTAIHDLKAAGNDLSEHVALVAQGGYGRNDVAPYSDVDLMLLYAPGVARRVAPLAERLVRDVFDVGLVLGQSVRTPREACLLARGDATIFTTLVESRWLAGSRELFDQFWRTFERQSRRRSKSLMASIQAARAQERSQFGETVYLLEPNVKRSPGALRDLQLLRWAGFASYGANDPDSLRLQGHLGREDFEQLQRAREFLLRLRNEMHFTAGKSNDQLDRVEQLRIAALFGYQDQAGLLAVEQFMREYFRLTQAVQGIVERFIQGAQPQARLARWLAPWVSHKFERDFRVSPFDISVTRRGLAAMQGDLAQVVRLADIANLYDKPIAETTRAGLRSIVATLPDEVTPAAAAHFVSLLQQPARLGPLLRTLYDLGVLETLIPPFRHARCLLQFNAYHKYTVDEHSLRAVEAATRFAQDDGPIGTVYRQLKRKWLLHLALLLHDLGKGFPEDHSEVGAVLAIDVAQRLGLDDQDTETLRWLVHNHLLMSHLAFRRDTSDEQLIVRFAVDVGGVETLEMLFVLTAADLDAVGPGTLNRWKIDVLADLFHRTIQHLSSDDPTLDLDAAVARRRRDVLARFASRADRAWFERQVEAIPVGYLRTTPPEALADDLEQLRPLTTADALAVGRPLSEPGTIEYRVGTYEGITPGVFHRLTGALTNQGLQILSAEIITLADGLIFDRFHVQDFDVGGDPEERIEEVGRALVAALRQPDEKPITFRRWWRPADQQRQVSVSPLKSRLKIDNSTSDRYTILDIFAADRRGLLYSISRTLFELGLNVSVAKIGTYLDQVVDVFYVTEHNGRKLEGESRQREVRERVLAAITELERQETEQMRVW